MKKVIIIQLGLILLRRRLLMKIETGVPSWMEKYKTVFSMAIIILVVIVVVIMFVVPQWMESGDQKASLDVKEAELEQLQNEVAMLTQAKQSGLDERNKQIASLLPYQKPAVVYLSGLVSLAEEKEIMVTKREASPGELEVGKEEEGLLLSVNLSGEREKLFDLIKDLVESKPLVQVTICEIGVSSEGKATLELGLEMQIMTRQRVKYAEGQMKDLSQEQGAKLAGWDQKQDLLRKAQAVETEGLGRDNPFEFE
jgi:Tfp pilus assembly protein PilO